MLILVFAVWNVPMILLYPAPFDLVKHSLQQLLTKLQWYIARALYCTQYCESANSHSVKWTGVNDASEKNTTQKTPQGCENINNSRRVSGRQKKKKSEGDMARTQEAGKQKKPKRIRKQTKTRQEKENPPVQIPCVFWVESQVWDLLPDAVSRLPSDRERGREALSGLTGWFVA